MLYWRDESASTRHLTIHAHSAGAPPFRSIHGGELQGVGVQQSAHWVYGLSVSPDGKTVVYPKITALNADLMLIEN